MVFLFDIGNVLINFDIRKLLHKIAGNSGLSINQVLNLFDKPELLKVETGKMNGKDYFDNLVNTTGLKWNYEDWIKAWADIYEINKIGFNLLKEVKSQKYSVYILSNLAAFNRDAIEIKAPEVLTETKYNFYSFELGYHKPDPRIYQEVCARLFVRPTDCVFIDDIQENIDGAISIGMEGIVYKNEMLEDIKRQICAFIQKTA
ncbi:MAG: HAD family phosphatase [Calditrichaeota bacterium]|nr:MAG: HAD family phosphatase [Calditrichota bacterium]